MEHDYFDDNDNEINHNNSYDLRRVFKTISSNNELYLSIIEKKVYDYMEINRELISSFEKIGEIWNK